MSRCLRCGAGNEWIDPIGKEAPRSKGKAMRHAAKVEGSARLKATLDILKRRGWRAATTRDIQKATGSMAPSTDVSELRANGYEISCKYFTKTMTGTKIYIYRLEQEPQPLLERGTHEA